MKTILLLLLLPLFGISQHYTGSRGGHYHYSSSGHKVYEHKATSYTSYHKATYSTVPQRDSHGKIKRSEAAKREFMHQTGYPHGRKGYVIDHIVPLKKGGCDCPANMQWQTIQEAKAKDKWE